MKKAKVLAQQVAHRGKKRKAERFKSTQCNLDLKRLRQMKEEMDSLNVKVTELEDQLIQKGNIIQTRSAEKGRPFLPIYGTCAIST